MPPLTTYDVYLTCCDGWAAVHIDHLPCSCPRCGCRLKWNYDDTPLGVYPFVLRYRPAKERPC